MGITEERIERIKKQAEILESCGKAAGGMSSELDALLQDNQQMEQQIERLNEANDRLRERLGHDDSRVGYMKLPVDADGEPIRVGDGIVHPNGKRGQVLGINYRKSDETRLFVLGDNGLAYTCEPGQVLHACPMEEAGTVPAAIVDELAKIAESLESPWARGDLRAVNAYEARLAHRIRKAIGEGGFGSTGVE